MKPIVLKIKKLLTNRGQQIIITMLLFFNKKQRMDKSRQNWWPSSQYNPRWATEVYAERVIDASPQRKYKRWRLLLIGLPAFYFIGIFIGNNLDVKTKELEQKQAQIATIIETRKELRLQMDEKVRSIREQLWSLSGDVQTIQDLNVQEQEIIKGIREYEKQWIAFDDYSDLFTKLREELKLLVNEGMKE